VDGLNVAHNLNRAPGLEVAVAAPLHPVLGVRRLQVVLEDETRLGAEGAEAALAQLVAEALVPLLGGLLRDDFTNQFRQDFTDNLIWAQSYDCELQRNLKHREYPNAF
jgi:hypothetical protein